MHTHRIHVTQLGRGFIAEGEFPDVTALGASADEAAENARRMALSHLELSREPVPGTLIVRIDVPGRNAVAMQSMGKPFSLEQAGKASGTCYFDSSGNYAAPRRSGT